MNKKSVQATALEGENAAMHDKFLQMGLTMLGLSETGEPQQIVSQIQTYLDGHRHDIEKQGRNSDEYAHPILGLGYLFGEQIHRAHSWEWKALEIDGTSAGVCVVEPQGKAYVNPVLLVKDIVDDSERSNNLVLVFSSTDSATLSAMAPELEQNRHLGLS